MRKITVNGELWYWCITKGTTIFITNKQPGSTPIRLVRIEIGILKQTRCRCEWCDGVCESASTEMAYAVHPSHIRRAILDHATTLQQPARRGKKPATGARSIPHNSRRSVPLSV